MSVAPPRDLNRALSNGSHKNGHSVASPTSPKSPSSLSSTTTRSDIASNLSSRSFLNLTSSALTGVFGSQTSLADLAGDTTQASFSSDQSDLPSSSIEGDDDFLDEANRSLTNSLNGGSLTKPRLRSAIYPASSSSSSTSSLTSASRPRSAPTQRHHLLPSLSSRTGSVRLSFLSIFVRFVTLFVAGVAYGELARNLHDNHLVTIETLDIAASATAFVSGPESGFLQSSVIFSMVFGAQGILLGLLLPLFDRVFPAAASVSQRKLLASSGKGGADWSSIIRAVAAFLGVAYGVRKLPWESTMQVAVLWGLVNPFLWYLLDGTRNGFILSALTAIVGTMVFAVLFPANLPQPVLSTGYIAVTVWIASTFYICSICFGNIGRRILSFDGGANGK